MGSTGRTLGLALAAVVSTGASWAQLGMGDDSDVPKAVGKTAATLAASAPDLTYRFGTASATAVKSRYFDLVKDSPNVTNAGQILSPGGTCFGMAYVTQYFYERVVYPVLSAGTAVREPDLGVPGPVDRTNLESQRLRAFSTTGAGRDKFQRLSASAHDNQHSWGNGASKGDPEACYTKWLAHVGSDQYALGFVSMREENDKWGHAVTVCEAQAGVAVTGTATTGPRVTRFRIVDPNQNYAAAGARANDYILYFHDAKRVAFSAEFQAVYEGPDSVLQSGSFVKNERIGYREPYGWWARYNSVCRDTTQGANLRWGEDLSQPKVKKKVQPDNVILDENGVPIASGEEFIECELESGDPAAPGASW